MDIPHAVAIGLLPVAAIAGRALLHWMQRHDYDLALKGVIDAPFLSLRRLVGLDGVRGQSPPGPGDRRELTNRGSKGGGWRGPWSP
jgi:hypothetical protein